MARLKELEPTVKSVLEEFPETRNDDFLLYTVVAVSLNEDVNYYSFTRAMQLHKKLGIPPFESVTRCRRKLQAKFPELAASDAVQDIRNENISEYMSYAKSK